MLPLSAGVFTKRLMAEHNLEFNYTSPQLLDIRIGDTLTYNGEAMTVNKQPEIVRTHDFQYTIIFQGHRYTLERFILKDEGALSFSYFGTPSDYLYMLVECLNSVDIGWTVGQVDEFEPVGIDFDKTYCLDALSMIAEAFGAEWQILGKQISIVKHVGVATTLSFEYGKGKGLYSLNRIHEDSSKVITRAYAQGGSQNLPAGYTKPNLQVDGFIEDATAVALYGVREGVFEDETIFPKRTSTATAVGQINEGTFTLTDATIDFDLEGQRISSTEAKIVFKSGSLNGQEFKILSYNHTKKEIRYEANKDANGNLIPFGVTMAEVGDKYTLIGIRMPSSYVDAAITELTVKRLGYLNENKIPRVRYELDIDVLNLRKLGVEPREGDLVTIIDSKLGINEDIRITSISYPAHYKTYLESGMKFTCEVGNEVHYMRVEKVEKDIKKTQEVVTQTTKESWEADRRNVIALNEFKGKVFDPDGNLEEALIQAIVGFFGTESMLFDLDPAPNITMGVDSFSISTTKLIHKKFEIAGLGYIWDLISLNATLLDPLKSYYLSARCSRTSLTGEWILSETQISTEDEVGYWHFNLGILSSVIEGSRSFRSTKGYTLISGGTIETDVISAYLINVNKLFAQLITVGSNGYVNAGISGLDDSGSTSQRLWAGATESNRYNAPFQVLDDGSMRAEKGKIGAFDITQESLKIGSNPTNGDTWDVNSQTVFLTKDYILMRDNGSVRGERREFTWNLYKESYGANKVAVNIFNNITPSLPIYDNIALMLEAQNGVNNYGLFIREGLTRLKGVCNAFQNVTQANQIIDPEYSMVFITASTVAVYLQLPQYPALGYEVTIKNLSPNDFILKSINGSIILAEGSSTMENMFRRHSIKTFFFNGQYWIELFNQSY